MRTKYIDLIEQTFDFPQPEFKLDPKGQLHFHDIDLMELIEQYGTPLKFTYLPKISENIQQCKHWFTQSMLQNNYKGQYHFAYCTKSSHFAHVLDEALKNDIHLETSSAYDLDIIEYLIAQGKLSKDQYILCNGYKTENYLEKILALNANKQIRMLPIIDNMDELEQLSSRTEDTLEIGIRIASEEEPKFEFYTSRLGIGYRNIVPNYIQDIKPRQNIRVKMLHFFVNTGINDNAYYWNELTKCLRVYSELKKVCPELDSLNIGGGFPIKNSLNFSFDYPYIIDEIIQQVKNVCREFNVPEPHIFTEFGSYTVGESGGMLFSVLQQKQQNDREKWNLIDSSFMTNLPDSWAINKRFLMLPVNRWEDNYERVLLGGLTCDSDDYYNSEQHTNAIYLPYFSKQNPLYIGFFNTGAYQSNIGGFGGLQHCLIPNPKHVLISKNTDETLNTYLYAPEQDPKTVLDLLGYQ